MGVMDTLRKAREAVVGSTSVATQARLIGNKPAAPSKVPEEAQRAMDEQGMVAGGNMSPGDPMPPYNEVGTPPIVRPFQVGQNIFAVPRQLTGVSFDSLKNITSKWDVARLCIEVRQDEIRNLDWDIVIDEDMVDDADLYTGEIKNAKQFFSRPCDGLDLDDLIMMSSDDWLRYDALTLFRHRTRNGKLGELEIVDGTTISPLIDGRGAIPRGEAPAYVQWAWGLPWTWLKQRDIIYKPHHPQPSSRYGLPPAEWVMLTANTDVRLQWYFLSYFTEGAVPEAFVDAPPDVQDPKSVKALQDAYDATISGARGAHHKVKWIPPGSKVTMVNKANFDVAFAGFMLAKGCAAYKVQPAQIGFTEKVNKSSGETQEDVTYRRSIIPSVRYYESIFNKILREDFDMPYARFKFLNIEEEEDQLKLAQTRQIYIQSAVLSPDEVRQELGYDVDPDAPVGRFVSDRTGLIFVDAASQEAARRNGNLAQQYDLGLGGEPEGNGELLDPRSAVVEPAIKPLPPKPKEQAGAEPTANPEKAVADELRKWRAAALKRAKDGKLQKTWQPVAIDPLLHKSLTAQLAGAKTPEDVRRIFDPLMGGDAPFTKRATDGPKGKLVARDQAKLDALQVALAAVVAAILHKDKDRSAEQIAGELEAILQAQTERPLVQDMSGAGGEATTGAGTPSTATGAVMDAAMQAKLLASVDAIVANLDLSALETELQPAVEETLKAIFEQAATEGAKTVGVDISWDYVNPLAVKYAEERAAELVGKKRLPDGTLVDNGAWSIPDTTRDMIKDHVVSAIKNGNTIPELQKGIQEHYAFSDARAETIARTETGTAYNRGGVAGFNGAGVQHVEVADGVDYDAGCAQANGEIWTLKHAEADPLGHPNCTRAFLPIPPDVDTLAPGEEKMNPRSAEQPAEDEMS